MTSWARTYTEENESCPTAVSKSGLVQNLYENLFKARF